MRVLLVSANAESINMPSLPLGLACVAAATRKSGHDVRVLDLLFEPSGVQAVSRTIEEFRPEVVGISVRNIDNQDMTHPVFLLDAVREIVAACRSCCDAPIVLGGAGYSIFPGPALRYLDADFGIPGEGESVFPDMVDRIAASTDAGLAPGVWSRVRPLQDRRFCAHLDDLPLPEPAEWIPSNASADLWIPVQTRRGCPLDCSYCSTSAIEGRTVRERSPAKIVHWLTRLRVAGRRRFAFVDNTFNLPLPYAKELCRKIIDADLDIEFWCIIYPKWVDAELAGLLQAAGCRQVSIGFESGSQPVLHAFNKRFGPRDITDACGMFLNAGIPQFGFLLLGGPGETMQSVEESLEFADSLPLETLKITAGIRIYPNTPLADIAVREHLIQPEDDLLQPRFYMAPALRDWLPERISELSRCGSAS